jgi:hypothetical protein
MFILGSGGLILGSVVGGFVGYEKIEINEIK